MKIKQDISHLQDRIIKVFYICTHNVIFTFVILGASFSSKVEAGEKFH